MARHWFLKLISLCIFLSIFPFLVSATNVTISDMSWDATALLKWYRDGSTAVTTTISGNDMILDYSGAVCAAYDVDRTYDNLSSAYTTLSIEAVTDGSDYVYWYANGTANINDSMEEFRLCAKMNYDNAAICEFDLYSENTSAGYQKYLDDDCPTSVTTLCSGWVNSTDAPTGNVMAEFFVGYPEASTETSLAIYEVWLEQYWELPDSCTAPASGDWTITDGDNCSLSIADTITGNLNISNGSLNIESGGNLTISGTYAYIYSGSNMTIESGGWING